MSDNRTLNSFKITQESLEAIKDHPLWIESQSQQTCFSEEMLEGISLVERGSWSEETKCKLQKAANEADDKLRFISVSCGASEHSSGGDAFHFILHAQTRSLLNATKGTWRGL